MLGKQRKANIRRKGIVSLLLALLLCAPLLTTAVRASAPQTADAGAIDLGVVQNGGLTDYISYLPLTLAIIDNQKLMEIDEAGGPSVSVTGSDIEVRDCTESGIYVDSVFSNVKGYYAVYGGSKGWASGATLELDGKVTFTYPDAALLVDGSRVDVVFEYSNIKIKTNTHNYGADPSAVGIALGRHLRVSTFGQEGTYTAWYYGLEVECKVYAKTTRSDSMYFSMHGINVLRENQNYQRIPGAGDYYNYTEQIEVLSDQTERGLIYIPEAESYETLVTTRDGHVWFVGQRGNNSSMSTGFTTTVLARDGLQFIFRAAGGYNRTGGMQTLVNTIYPGDGSFQLTSSTTPGGNIQTTAHGNSSGDLTLINSEDVVIGPSTVGVPMGKSVTYTMTPEPGFSLQKVMVDGVEVTPTPVTDGSGNILYYTYTFSNITADHAIHVVWTTTLELSKTVSGNMGDRSKYFRFDVALDASSTGYKDMNGSSKLVPMTSFPCTIDCTNADVPPNSTSLTLTESTPISVYLQHGQSLKISGLPKNAVCTVTEVGDGYTTQYHLTTLSDSTGVEGDGYTVTKKITEPTAIAYKNERTTPVPTGIVLSAAPAWTGMGITTALFGALFLGRRRRRDE